MSRTQLTRVRLMICFPRVSGDEPALGQRIRAYK